MLIGQVAQKYEIAIDTLRYYDRIGLLTPERSNGVRRYSEKDLIRLEAVLKMKKLLFSLEEIEAILAVDEQIDRGLESQNLDIPAVKALLSRIRAKHREVEEMENNIREVKQNLAGMAAKIENFIQEGE